MIRLQLSLLACCLLLQASSSEAQQPAPKPKAPKDMSIAEIMKECHKKPIRLLKKVATGQANEAEKKRLVDVYTALSKAKPPKGDAGSWKEKTQLLVSAAQAASQGKPDAKQLLTKASNCTACHNAHKQK